MRVAAPEGVNDVSPRIQKAAEMVAAEVLREALLGSETSSVCSGSRSG